MERMTSVLPDVEYVHIDGDDELQRCWQTLATTSEPVVVVPGRRDVPTPVTRVLLPLDGTEASTAAVHPVLDLLARDGVEIIVLHVFTAATVPRFWDQPVHAAAGWKQEFRTRHRVPPGARLVLRDGHPGDNVLDVATREGVDLIALGWSGRLDDGHAETVREAVRGTRVPVLLMPVDGPRVGPSARPPG